MANRTWNERRWNRFVHATRRMKEDRAQHGNDFLDTKFECECFHPDGRTFSRFADHPKRCSGPCCGNPRRHFGAVTRQERRAGQVGDWHEPIDS
jgi:hypothetical protein